MTRGGARPSQTVAGRDVILSAIESRPDASDGEIATALGVSRQRVGQVRRGTGQRSPARPRRKAPKGTTRTQQARRLLAGLEASPHLAGTAEERLADALRSAAAVEQVVRLLADDHDHGRLTERERAVWAALIGEPDRDVVKQLAAFRNNQP